MTEATKVAELSTKPQSQSPLACRLRATDRGGRHGQVVYMGEVELENCSAMALEIEYTLTPLQHLELEVSGSDGRMISEGHFSDRFSPSREPAVLRLLPGEKFTAPVALLATVPRDKRAPGKYRILASYRFQDRKVLAEPLILELANGA